MGYEASTVQASEDQTTTIDHNDIDMHHSNGRNSSSEIEDFEVSGTIVSADERLIMISPDYQTKSARSFRPGALVHLSNGKTACTVFEAAGFTFALLIPPKLARHDSSGTPHDIDTEVSYRERSPTSQLLSGTEVFISQQNLTFSFSERTIQGGSVLDCFGEEVMLSPSPGQDTGTERAAPVQRLAFNPAPGQFDRQVIRENIHTGVTAIDALTPFGKGQSMLVFGEPGTGKTTIGQDVVLAQQLSNNVDETAIDDSAVYCIYAATGLDPLAMNHLVPTLLSSASKNTTLVTASKDHGDESALFAALCACSLGEHYRDRGQHAMVILDEVRLACKIRNHLLCSCNILVQWLPPSILRLWFMVDFRLAAVVG